MKNNDAFEAEMCSALMKKYKLHLEKSCFSTGSMPNYLLLDSTRNIHSYIEFCDLEDGKLESSHVDSKMQDRGVLGIIRTQYSQLDRPLFFVFKDSTGVFHAIESTPIREHLLEARENNISAFMIQNADRLQDVLPQIYKEL